MSDRNGGLLSENREEVLPKSLSETIEKRRYQAVLGISTAGLIILLGNGLSDFIEVGNPVELAARTIPVAAVFLSSILLCRYDRNARRSAPLLVVFSAVAMVVVRLFSASEAAGHFLFLPAGAIGSVLLLGFETGIMAASLTAAALFFVYAVNVYLHPFPVFIPADRPASFISAFLMTLVMIVLAGVFLNDMQRQYEKSNRLLREHLDKYRSLLSLLTNDLTTSISELKEAESENDVHGVRKSFKQIREVISTARKLRGESLPEIK